MWLWQSTVDRDLEAERLPRLEGRASGDSTAYEVRQVSEADCLRRGYRAVQLNELALRQIEHLGQFCLRWNLAPRGAVRDDCVAELLELAVPRGEADQDDGGSREGHL